MTKSEKDVLVERLDSQRAHILNAIDGLSSADLRRPVLPTGWTCLGLVNHLALDVERLWFTAIMGGDEEVARIETDGREDGWHVPAEATAEEIIAGYRREIERADAVIAAVPLDAAPAWWPPFFPNYRLDNLRELLMHVIVETATHAGHLDATRELIDGRTWLVLS
jgi:uncharacterized damage-inducible protein DinB